MYLSALQIFLKIFHNYTFKECIMTKVKNITIKLVTIFTFFFHQSCELFISKVCKDEEFAADRNDNNSNKLRLNGYYYGKNIRSTDTSSVTILLLNQNGILQDMNSFKKEDAEKGSIVFDSISLSRPPTKPFWGIYNIEDNNIKVQIWEPSTTCFPVLIHEGKILNDSTFRINVIKNLNGKILKEGEVTYKFKSYFPKPDSVVSFIK
jgi:hypothetical protein